MLVEINDRLYSEFAAWAQANGIDSEGMRKYIERAFRDKFTVDRYGDLNEKIGVKAETDTEPAPNKPRTTRFKKPAETETVPEQAPSPTVGDVKVEASGEANAEAEPKLKRKTKIIASR